MIKFIGEYYAKLDDKGRVVFPANFKALMAGENGDEGRADMRLIVRKDIYENCLQMFTYAEWERESEKLKERLDFFNKDHARFWREYMRNRSLVEADGKLGRISIPKKLLDEIGVNKDIVFFGNDHKIEIWAKEIFEQGSPDQQGIEDLAKTLSK